MVATKTCFTVVDLFKTPYAKTHFKRPCDAQNGTQQKRLHDVLA